MGMPEEPAYDQDAFRGRVAVPNPTGINAAFNGSDPATNANFTMDVDTTFRIRFVIQQTVAIAINTNNQATEFALQFNLAGGGWVNVAAQGVTTQAVAYADGDFADGDNTTQLIGSGTFIAGDGVEVTPSDTITFTDEALTETELEFALTIVSSRVSDAQTLQLRVIHSDSDESPPATVLDSYTNTPTITVSEVGGGTVVPQIMNSYRQRRVT
jgi:hypothetical protein